jgi:DNA-binding transcriptional regulator YdaS (Cro superfamily)
MSLSELQKKEREVSVAALERAISIAGSGANLARAINDYMEEHRGESRAVNSALVSAWKKAQVPSRYAIAIEKATGVSRCLLNPEHYPEADYAYTIKNQAAALRHLYEVLLGEDFVEFVANQKPHQLDHIAGA